MLSLYACSSFILYSSYFYFYLIINCICHGCLHYGRNGMQVPRSGHTMARPHESPKCFPRLFPGDGSIDQKTYENFRMYLLICNIYHKIYIHMYKNNEHNIDLHSRWASATKRGARIMTYKVLLNPQAHGQQLDHNVVSSIH